MAENRGRSAEFWDNEYLPYLPRPRFRSPMRHLEPSRVDSHPSVKVLHNGHSRKDEKTGDMYANCTVTLIKGSKFNIIVDTMTAWDGDKLKALLLENSILPSDISYVVCSHSHSDHVGCNYLFDDAFHIIGNTMCVKERYIACPLDDGDEFYIEPKVKVICTPGHTADSVTVLVETEEFGLVAVTGDLFEREADIEFPQLWRETAGSKDPETQEKNRKKILMMADYIVPGHGHMFKNTYRPTL